MTKEGLVGADSERNDCPRLGEMHVHAIDHAGPHFFKTVVEHDNSALHQRTFAGGQVMRGDVCRMSTVDADDAQWAAAELKKVRGGQFRRIALVNNQPAGIRVPAEISLESFQIARAGVIDIQILLREEVDGDRRLILCAEKIKQDEKLAVMNANLRYASTQIGAALFIGQKDNGLGRSGKEPTLYEMLTVLEICSQTASAHVVIVFA